MDPHSDVSAALLNQCKVIALAEIIANSDLANVIHEKNMSLISPDAGAEKKVQATAKMIARDGQAVEVLGASKIRDSLSGKITATHIYGAVTDKDYIILDDICDGGATFSLQDAAMSGAAHLTSFFGTDTVPAIDLMEDYYHANAEHEMIGCSVPATEHSVMCMGMQDGELTTFKRLINELYPHGIVSIVADTWDFWRVVTEYTLILKDDILPRDGKLVIRPDSGDPVKIVVGDADAPLGTPEHKGAIECLWDVFGGTMTEQGYKLLDSHIGLIYGDSITLERAEEILQGLARKGFAAGNIVFGVGSFTYQYVTRDNFSFAMKATSGIVNGERRDIFKDPKTDSGTKKSAKGLLRVEHEDGTLKLYDQQTVAEENLGILEVVFLDGKLLKSVSLADIRKRIDAVMP